MFVKPTNAPVLHPATRQPIPAEGIEVPEDTYWLRRVRCGDVVVLVPPPVEVVQVSEPIPDSPEEQS